MNNKLILKDNKSPHVDISYYPDGQANVKVDLQYFDEKTPIDIQCRIKNFAELEVLMCIVSALHKNDRVIAEIGFVYLFGQRSDRAFEIGQPNYFRDVVSPLVLYFGSCCGKISLFFPHGTLNEISLRKDNTREDIQIKYLESVKPIVIFADKSASIKFSHFDWRILAPIYFDKVCKLNRPLAIEMNGERQYVLQTIIEKFPDKDILIFDDMCDGGATFEEEGKWLKDNYPEKKLTLFVAHGIFSKGFDKLLKYFDKIITTNSYQDFPQNVNDPFRIDTKRIEVIEVI